MTDPFSKRPARRGVGIAIFVLLSALLLTMVGAGLLALFFSRLPLSQRGTLAGTNLNTRFVEVFRGASAEAREGRAFWELANEISRAVAPSAKKPQISNARMQAALSASTSQLGRILAAGAVFSVAEAEGRTAEQTWAAVRPYLEGLSTAKFARYEIAHENLLASVFRVGSIQAGTARQLAAESTEAYTPFLQFFVGKLSASASERAAANDPAAAELCRTLKLRLLRDWVLEPGRAGTRLLAADLLSRELAAEPKGQAVADAVVNWRNAYRVAARANPAISLSQTNEPDMTGGSARSVSGLLIGAIGLACATLLVAVAGIALAWPLLTNATAIRSTSAWFAGIAAAVLVLAIGVIAIRSGFQPAMDDVNGAIQRLSRTAAASHKAETWLPVYWARLPWNGAALGGAALVVAIGVAAVAEKSGNRRGGIAAGVAICWLLLAAGWSIIAGWGVMQLSTYESILEASYRKGAIAVQLGDAGEAQLTPVREWQP